MAEKTTPAAPVQEIATIREILMGDYIREYAAQFKAIDEHFATFESDVDSRFKALEQDMNNKFSALEQHMNERLDALDAKLEASVKRLDDKIDKTSVNQKQKLGQLFNILGSQITSD
jgi:Skp family chaperone for outer membrane proteins